MSSFNAVFERSAGGQFALLGAETITLARPHTLRDSRGQVQQLRVRANAAIGATSVQVEPLSGTLTGMLPTGTVLAAGVVLSAELQLVDKSSWATVQVVALAAGLTAGTIWTLPAGSSWPVRDCLPFEDKRNIVLVGSGASGGDVDRGHQAPKISIPATSLPAGVAPRAGDVITWSRGRSRIVGTPKNLGDTYDVEFEAAG